MTDKKDVHYVLSKTRENGEREREKTGSRSGNGVSETTNGDAMQ